MSKLTRLFGGGASSSSPGLPLPPPPPPPPPPTRDDPAIAEARTRLRSSELRRKGRSALMLTGGRGVEDEALIERPAARGGAKLLGEAG